MVEKLDPDDAPSTLSIIGRYILLPRVFDYLSDRKLARGEPLTDPMARMIGDAISWTKV